MGVLQEIAKMSASTDTHIEQIVGGTFSGDCAHCRTRSVGFVIHDGVAWGKHSFDLFAECPRCKRGVIATFSFPDSYGSRDKLLLRALRSGCIPDSIVPRWSQPSAPLHTPQNVAHYFIQGKENVARNWDAAGMMFRETLEAALKELFPALSGKLNFKIKEAAAQQLLTPGLAEWAHHIRLEGNKAAHDAPYTEQEAEALAAFTEMVLVYLFTLPGMVEKKRAESQTKE